jgi:hypothetical protein
MKIKFFDWFLIVALAVSLGACSTPFGQGISNTIAAIQGYTVTQNMIDASRSTYDGTILAPLTTYASWRRCRTGEAVTVTNLCHDRFLLKKIRTADASVASLLNQLQDLVTSGNNSGAVAAYKSLQQAIVTAQSLIAASGVNGIK